MSATDTDTRQPRDVLIFYSSKTEPGLLDLYQESITYLEDSGVDTAVIDVSEDLERAQKHDIITTPTVIVRTGDTEKRHIGVMSGLKDVLEEDIYGQSLLHQRGFKEGRTFGQEQHLQGADRKQIEDALYSHVVGQGVQDIQVTALDQDACTAEGRVTPDPDTENSQNWHAKLEEFLGGVFTEVFGTGVMCTETQCVDDGNDHCEFTIEQTE